MYGIVNKAIKGLVTEKFGDEAWDQIKERSGVQIDTFLSNEPYDDAITFKLAGAAADVLGVTVTDVLHLFGEYWIMKTGKEEYGSLMDSGGENFAEFMQNLPNFHSRVMLMFPNLEPPEFRVSEVKDKEMNLHYYSHREGLTEFVTGLIYGLGKMYNTEVEAELIESRAEGSDHEVFHVKWK